MKKKYYLVAAIVPLLILLGSCKKFVDVKPPAGTLLAKDIFKSPDLATSAISTMYINFIGYPTYEGTISLGLYADELENAGFYNQDEQPFAASMIPVLDDRNNSFWAGYYERIYSANAALEGLAKSTALSKDLNDQLAGESLFLRAFNYYYLLNLYGDVPIVTTTDYTANASLPRQLADAVAEQIINDLEKARILLKSEYPVGEKVRANKWAATALLARVYLYQKQWDKAAQMAGEIIASGQYPLATTNEAFLKASSEAILQISQTTRSQYSAEAFIFIPYDNTIIPDYPLTNSLVSSFENGDKRLSDWTGSNTVENKKYYYAGKYKDVDGFPPLEYYVLLRSAEQYSIRAEASAHLNNLPQAISDIDVLRARAGLPLIKNTRPGINQIDLLTLIEHENRIEFFAEMGHRWFDLKRTGKADNVLKALKPATWNVRGLLFPVPQTQLDANPSLKQNPGY